MEHSKQMSRTKVFVSENTMLFFAIVLFILCLIVVPRFATSGNLMNIMIQISNQCIDCMWDDICNPVRRH